MGILGSGPLTEEMVADGLDFMGASKMTGLNIDTSRIDHAAQCLAQEVSSYHATFFSALKPRLFMDGDMWCALYGDNLQEGIAGFGKTPAKALFEFEANMHKEK